METRKKSRFKIDRLEERIAPTAAVTAPVTPATAIHGLPGNNAGFSDQAYGAAPDGSGPGDGGIHNIGAAPGQNGETGAQDPGGPAGDMHAGEAATTGYPG